MSIFNVIVPAESRTVAEWLAGQLNPSTEGEAFVVPLQNSGGQITHYGCQPNITTEQAESSLMQLQASGILPGAIVERVLTDDLRGEFLALLSLHGLAEVPE